MPDTWAPSARWAIATTRQTLGTSALQDAQHLSDPGPGDCTTLCNSSTGMATVSPSTVVISAWEMPPAISRGITGAKQGDRLEGDDHAGDGTEQAHQRRDRGDDLEQ